ncbi:sugar transporter [Microdochium bolleyi]|uniref:Sugar transporter n=1 Tax=Microdochium bolleyi TaxID=196109 RepID=A0A136IUX2_9PEZI|nr:sugar transporter [Microdochium bolleyi]
MNVATAAKASQGSQTPWWRQRELLRLNFVILSLVMFSSANGYDGSVMGGLLALKSWNQFMEFPTGTYLGWINAIYFLGSAIAFPAGAWVSNRYGRKPGMYIGYAFLVVGIAMQSAAQNERTFTYARLLIGISSALLSICAPVLLNEIAHPMQRAIVSALYMCGYYVGGTISSWVTFGTRDIASDWAWRIPVILQCALPLLALPGFLIAPESPRWLISVGRNEEATRVLATHHAGGRMDDPIVLSQMVEMETTITAEKEAAHSGSYIDMSRTPGNRHRLMISVALGFISQWAGNGVISYYLPLVLNSVGVTSVTDQTLINACLNVWNLLWALAAATSVDRFGRRGLFLASAILMFVSFVIVTALSGSFAQTLSSKVGVAVIPFLFLFFAGYDIALTPFLVAYPVEIWQFTMRSRGLTVTWITALSSIFLNTFVNGIALDKLGWKYYILFCVLLFLWIVFVWFAIPETRGHTLEQMAVVFDGEDAVPTQTVVLHEKQEVESDAKHIDNKA